MLQTFLLSKAQWCECYLQWALKCTSLGRPSLKRLWVFIIPDTHNKLLH